MPGRSRHLVHLALLAAGALACGSDPGTDGSDIPVPYGQLGGGILFATSAIKGSAGYDLYWIPFPDTRVNIALPPTRITSAQTNEWQPSVARNGKGIAFAVQNDGIHVITTSGRVRRISDTNGTNFKDSLPCVSAEADRVAWVREDTSKELASGFFETKIMLANFDGTNEQAVAPKAGVVQDAPVFDPAPNATRLAWTEFNPSTLVPANGPRAYGIYVHDFVKGGGRFACQSDDNGRTPGATGLPDRGVPYRCWGQHLAWPKPSQLVATQDMVHLDLTDETISTIWPDLIHSVQTQQAGIPVIEGSGRALGFFPPFPLSASYSADGRQLVMDGVMVQVDGDQPTLAHVVASADGGEAFRITIDGYTSDLDTTYTANFLFSVATPQIVPVLPP